jgi:hypothetical protein
VSAVSIIIRKVACAHFSTFIEPLSSSGFNKNFKPRKSLIDAQIILDTIPTTKMHLVIFRFLDRFASRSGISFEAYLSTISRFLASMDINLYELGLKVKRTAGISKATCQYFIEMIQ